MKMTDRWSLIRRRSRDSRPGASQATHEAVASVIDRAQRRLKLAMANLFRVDMPFLIDSMPNEVIYISLTARNETRHD